MIIYFTGTGNSRHLAKKVEEAINEIPVMEMLFNAPATCGSYYRAKVNHDFHDSG